MKTVAIVIPCLNEKDYIIKCLSSIAAQSYADNLISTYVCDGNSNDGTQQLITEFIKEHPQFHLLINTKKTTPFALNLGIQTTNTDIIIILGAHSELDKDFVAKNVESLATDANVMCAGGILENVYENRASQIIGAAMSSSFGVGNAHFRTGTKQGYVDTVAFGAYKKEIFDKVGLFDEELIRNQDDEFNYRITSNGYKILLNPDIKCQYYVRASYSKLFKQYFQYGYWKVYVNKKHRAITTVRQLIPLFFVLYLISLALCFLINWQWGAIYSVFLGLYFLLAFVFALRKSTEVGAVFGIAFTFGILHFSYGIGYLKGIIDFFIAGKSIKKQESLSR